METIKLNAGETNLAGKDVEAGVELVKAAVGHLDRDILNIVLLTALVQNTEHHAKLSDEYKQAAEQFGHEPTWGGGEIKAKCGAYMVDVKISHDTGSVIKEMLAQAIAEGKNPLAFLTGMLGDDDEPCDCPNCRAERGEGSTH